MNNVKKTCVTLPFFLLAMCHTASAEPYESSIYTIYQDPKTSYVFLATDKKIEFGKFNLRDPKFKYNYKDYDALPDCSKDSIKCVKIDAPFAIDTSDRAQKRVFDWMGYRYTPACIQNAQDGSCWVSVITIRNINGVSEGVKHVLPEQDIGFFIYQRDFGIKAIGLLDPSSPRIAAIYSYIRGKPFLSKNN